MATAVQAVTQWITVTPMGNVRDWYDEALTSLARISALNDNWDGYGSPPLQQTAKDVAAKLLLLLSRFTRLAPHIAPVSGGGLQLEWVYDNRELELEVLPNGDIEFLAILETGDMFDDRLSDWEGQVTQLVHWLITGVPQ
jgi:hypothetical protein